jgi:hypothetical protein
VANGIAVVVANTYFLDGWESEWRAHFIPPPPHTHTHTPTHSRAHTTTQARVAALTLSSGGVCIAVTGYPEIYQMGFDPPFWAALDKAFDDPGSPPEFRALNKQQIAVHGWSGGAQEVSFVIQLWASGQLGGLRVVAGIMSAGASYACYDTPPLARGVCANCSMSGSVQLGCSNVTKSKGVEPNCEYCCPDHFTEEHYFDHPEDYVTHPWTFLFQTEIDSDADSCATACVTPLTTAVMAPPQLCHSPTAVVTVVSLCPHSDADSCATACVTAAVGITIPSLIVTVPSMLYSPQRALSLLSTCSH